MRAEAEWAQTPKRVSTNNTSRMDTQVSRKTTRGWAKIHRGHKDIRVGWARAQRHRVGRKSQRLQKDRVGTNTASARKHKECAQAEGAETPTRDRERSK